MVTRLAHDVSISELTDLVDRSLAALGLIENDRRIVSEVLLYAELRGNSQGLIKIIERTILPDSQSRQMATEDRSSVSAHIEANGNIGMVVLSEATGLATKKCTQHGIAIVTTSGCASSSGALGYYCEHIAEQGYIGIVMSGSPKVMALHGTAEPSMGTNPVAFAAPTSGLPLVIDFATAGITVFDVLKRRNQGQSLPEGVAVDSQGNPVVSAEAALSGALLAFGGVKGSALALLIETLTGPLCGAAIVGDQEDRRGHFVLAVDPQRVGVGAAQGGFRQRLDTMLERMQATGATLPGSRSRNHAAECMKRGTVSVPGQLLDALQDIVSDHKI